MPVQTSPPSPASFPSFMSVFGGDHRLEDRGSAQSYPSTSNHFPNHHPPSTHSGRQSYQPHRGSITSVGSDSTDSSPTTTISTFDSASVTVSTDPSPSSSPESPTSAAPTSPFKTLMNRPKTVASEQAEREAPLKNQLSPLGAPRPGSPGSRPRNVKNLSLNVVPNANAAPATSSVEDPSHALSAPTSPVRLPPHRQIRRKPTNLTIQTPSFDQATFAAAGHGPIPPTPSNRPSLRHFESSPSLQSVFSPTSQPPGGMQFPRPVTGGRLESESSGRRILGGSRDHEEVVAPRSQETVERGYTSGPVRVYDSGLYLYLEPTEEEASKFDVIINVAKEVKNPFVTTRERLSRPPAGTYWKKGDNAGIKQNTTEPQTALTEKSFKSAFEWLSVDDAGVAQNSSFSGPEYIHVPWDHNSEILDDLYPLCQLIDQRIAAGKSVLVHCQLGVSRSASLVIAYGLYKKYHLDFHSMYTAVKERSRWVGPNMSLIYQLMDFRAKMARRSLPDNSGAPTISKQNDAEVERVSKSVSETALQLPPTPSTLPTKMVSIGIQTDFEPLYSLPHRTLPSKSTTTSSTQTDAPSQASNFNSSTASSPPARRVVTRPLPLRQAGQVDTATSRQAQEKKGRNTGLTGTIGPILPLHLRPAGPAVPPTPSVFSPRAAEFSGNPFRRSIAGDLALSPRNELPNGFWDLYTVDQAKVQEEDPRSPHQTAQGKEIIRSIDELL